MYTLHVRELKADFSDAFLIFLANSKCRRCERDTVQHAFLLDRFSCFSTFLLFDSFPILHDLSSSTDLGIAKDVGMAADQLGVDLLKHITDGERTFLASNLGMQVDLE